MRHFITLSDITEGELRNIFSITEDLKDKYSQGLRETILPGRVMAMLFEKQSLRTRVSFEAGMTHLGGSSLFLGDDSGYGSRESIADFTRVLSEFVDVIVARTFKHETVEEFAAHATCSVINGLTDFCHPCQAVADLFTIKEEFGSLEGQTLTFVGDANNVARSLALGCGKVGMKMRLAAPAAYHFEPTFLELLGREVPNLDLTVMTDPLQAVRGAAAVYADVWASMGQEDESQQRRRDFAEYQVNTKLMQAAGEQARFMHCLPAKRGEEVTDEVIDGPRSIVISQAGNRMHAQKGILVWLLGSQR